MLNKISQKSINFQGYVKVMHPKSLTTRILDASMVGTVDTTDSISREKLPSYIEKEDYASVIIGKDGKTILGFSTYDVNEAASKIGEAKMNDNYESPINIMHTYSSHSDLFRKL